MGLVFGTLALACSTVPASAQSLDAERLGRSLDQLVRALQATDMGALEPALAPDFRVGEFSGGMARSIIAQVVASGRLRPESIRVDSVRSEGGHHRVYVTFQSLSGDRAHDVLVDSGARFVEINVMRVEATSQTRIGDGGGTVAASEEATPRPGETDAVLRDRLLRMLEADQAHRRALAALGDAPDPDEARHLLARMRRADSLNVAELIDILDTHRWPRATLVGREASLAAMVVLQHAPPGVQARYLSMAREAVQSGDLDASHLALLEDRVRMHQDQPQLYGTQLVRDAATGQLRLWPIEDEENVDTRRAGIGLPPLADYLRGFGVAYPSVP